MTDRAQVLARMTKGQLLAERRKLMTVIYEQRVTKDELISEILQAEARAQ